MKINSIQHVTTTIKLPYDLSSSSVNDHVICYDRNHDDGDDYDDDDMHFKFINKLYHICFNLLELTELPREYDSINRFTTSFLRS